jgi:hypothetical protein
MALILSGGKKNPGMKKTFVSAIYLPKTIDMTYLLTQLPI